MIRYITRHAQVASCEFLEGDAMFTVGEPPISELGREQARLLGERLKNLNFHGKILSSPYLRTLETAEIIAEITDTLIVPYAPMREVCRIQGQLDRYRGCTIEEIRSKFKRIDPTSELEYPWWTQEAETQEMLRDRVMSGYARACEMYKDEDILFVGHGASAGMLVYMLDIPAQRRSTVYNCSLSAVDPDNPGFRPFKYDTSHMPYEITTHNFVHRETHDTEFFAKPYDKEIELPDLSGFERKLLHIGDTHSDCYPYYKALIERVKPDIILHTGDMADEVKVGRIPSTQYEYLTKTKVLIDIMKDSGAQLIIVPGNNDMAGEIEKMAPDAKVCERNTLLTIDGVQCRVGHEVARMTFDMPYAFYGHGFTGEEWSYEQNENTEFRRFNVIWGAYVCDLKNGKYVRIETPELR